MSWLYLLIAGLLEATWAVALKHTDGFTRLWPSMVVGAAIAGSMLFLAVAVRAIPIATAYAVWVGIGILGTAIAGPALYEQPLRPTQVFFIGLMLVAIFGLKISSSR